VALRTTCIKNIKFKIIKIRIGCQYVGYFYYSQNLLCRAKSSTGPHAGRGSDIAGTDSHRRLDEGAPVRNCGMNLCVLRATWYWMRASSQQGLQNAFDRFSAACDKAGMKISTKKIEVLCLSRRPRQCILQVSGNKLHQVPWDGILERRKSEQRDWYTDW